MSKPLTMAAREILEAEIKRADKRKIKELRAEIERKDKLIEQMREALGSAEIAVEFCVTSSEGAFTGTLKTIEAALDAAGRNK